MRIWLQLALEMKEATEYADNAPYPKPEDTLTHVYADSEEGDGNHGYDGIY